MLKARALALCVCVSIPVGAAGATEPAELAVGVVRDEDGLPVQDASVRAFDRSNAFAGQDRTDGLGTFAVHLLRPATTLELRCRHCRRERVPFRRGDDVVIVARRYTALESDLPGERDLTALPYGRPADVLGLVPYVIPSAGGTSVSDRGLGGGRALVLADGAALGERLSAASALADLPNRSVRRIALQRANATFGYGPFSGGGIISLDTLGDGSQASADAGAAPALAVSTAVAHVHPAFSASNDDGTLVRRGDVDLTVPFAGGALRAGMTSGVQRIETGTATLARDVDGARVTYATASTGYRTFTDFAASRVAVSAPPGLRGDYRASYIDGGFRVERPAQVALAAGIRTTRESGSYGAYALGPAPGDGRAASTTEFLEAHAGDEATRVDLSLASTAVSTQFTPAANAGTAAQALLPALTVRRRVADSLFVRSGFSESLHADEPLTPSPSRAVATPVRRSRLLDSELEFDAGGRVKADGILYREATSGGPNATLQGAGAALVWQVAPLVSLRAWSLCIQRPVDASTYATATATATSRQVLWATYDRRDALRIDVIVRRDAGTTHGTVALDADVLVPVGPHVAFDAITLESGTRYFGIGVRIR